jgi:peptide/nickel transport system ATP-binding protein
LTGLELNEHRPTAGAEAVLEVRDLVAEFNTPDGVGRAVNGISFDIHRGETLGIVGESGCGKSVTALAILQLVPSPGRIASGTVNLLGSDLVTMPERQIRNVRGNEISMIFQEPMTSLNPVLTIGYQIAETVRRHQHESRAAARARAIEMLDLVRIPEPARRAGEFPHQLSGGMRQRAMIAMALSCNPQLLIADEPTTALDVTIQAQVLDLIKDLQRKLGTAVMLITHDLGVIAETADRVIVMYAGRKIEEASVNELFAQPQHPYTRGLLASVPRLGASCENTTQCSERLNEIPGIVPALTDRIEGCAFAARCARVSSQCRRTVPVFEEKQPGHWTACWHAYD